MSLSTTARNAWNTIKNETIRRANTALRVGNAGNAILDYCDEIAFNTVGNLKYFGEWNSSIPTYETHYMYSYRGQLYLPIAQHSSSIDPYTDTTNWKPMTSVIGRTVTTQVQIDTFTSEPHVFLIDNRLDGIALPVDDEFLVCKNTYTRTVGAGGDTYIQEFTDSKGLKYQRVSVWGGSAYVWNTWSTCIVITTQNKLDSFRPDNGFANVANLPSMHTAFGADYISVIVRSYAVNATGTTAGDWAQEATNSLGVDYIRYFSTVGATWGAWQRKTETYISKDTGILSWTGSLWAWLQKVTTWNATPSDSAIPTEKLVKDSLDLKLDKPTATKTIPIDADSLVIKDSADSNKYKDVLKADLNEVYVGDSTPTHNEVLVIDTTSINNLSFIANTSSFIVPDFASVIAKYTSNYASGNAVSVEFPINPPTTNEPVQYLVIKNLKGSDVTFVVNTGDDVVGSITYTYELMQTDSIVVPSGKRVELSYMYMMTSATTCLVSIMYKVQE
ncbi:hypothetical protein UFOVP756_46 [uncultured Caudovirales phage]|uniref:Uncharacterized protein n=1 Tax=uncultured Caudovirales phage TaxID=2100421 RepID=A0A6J7X5I7_9CAUD|nr:hypothetical protein UFOVP756_46 [uncultured Caudovirales phage]